MERNATTGKLGRRSSVRIIQKRKQAAFVVNLSVVVLSRVLRSMLSIGIRFGEGFDKHNVLRLMQAAPAEWDYDVLVIGTSPGGVACAREASLAGKKTALVKWRKYSPAEEEGFDEDLQEMARVLTEGDQESTVDSTENSSAMKLLNKNKSFVNPVHRESKSVVGSSKASESRRSSKKGHWSRKIRESRLDLNNELYKRGKEGRKLMLKAATLPNSLKEAINFGWKIYASFKGLTINWKKMSDLVMDYIMKENWTLVNALAEEGVEILEGKSSFLDHHTVRFRPADGREWELSADVICLAPSAEYVLPQGIPGAGEYGITCDDFLRLSEPPGRTLVVGGTPEALECAAIVACFGIPVMVVSRSDILKGHDRQITRMIVENLKEHGVVFREGSSLMSIKQMWNGRLLVEFEMSEVESEEESVSRMNEEFDTVVFATERQVHLDQFNLKAVGIELDPFENKIITDNENMASAPNVYVVGDAVAFQPGSPEISQTVGKLLGKRLFSKTTDVMDYSMVPYVVITPIEYGFVGVSEDGALYRFGKECIEIVEGTFTPIELVANPQECLCYVKAVVYRPKNLVIGLHMFGPEAGEIIQGFASAMRMGMTANKLESLIAVPATKAHRFTAMRERQTPEKVQ